MTGSQLTEANFDRSSILLDTLASILKSLKSNDIRDAYRALFGELQVAFVQFLLCETLPAFEQWKKLVIFLCSCEKVMKGEKLGSKD